MSNQPSPLPLSPDSATNTNSRTNFTRMQDHIAGFSAELMKLENEPTNAALEARMAEQFERNGQLMAARFEEMMVRIDARFDTIETKMAAESHNNLARNMNSFLRTPEESLSQLRNAVTNAEIPDFPPTPAALKALSWAQKRRLFRDLGLPEPPTQMTRGTNAFFTRKLRSYIGLRGERIENA